MASAGRKIGIGTISLGVALAGVGVFAGGASAESGGVESNASCTASFNVMWGLDHDPNHISVDDLVGGGTTVVSNGKLTVTLSNAKPIAGMELTDLTIGSLDFATDKPVDSVEIRLWQAPGDYDFDTLNFDPPAKSGSYASKPGSHPILASAPIKGLEFCYEAEVAPSSTAVPSTTSSIAPSSTSVAPTTSAEVGGQQVTTTVPVEVLPQVETAPQIETAPQAEIAFTGSDTGPLVAVGGALVAGGLALLGIDRIGLVRKGRHSR